MDDNIYLLLAGVVWIIYVLDRFLDNKVTDGERCKSSARHAFHERYWKWFKIAIFVVFGFCAAIAFQLPLAIYFHGIPVLLLVSVYFFLVVFSDYERGQPQVFKNIIAGLTFSYGVALGVFFFRPSSFWLQLIFTRENIMFGLLCACNITAIDLWEASRASKREEAKTEYGFILTIPLLLLVIFSFMLALVGDGYARPFFLAVMVAAGLLKVLNYYRSHFSLNALRALADLALIIPAPIFWIYLKAL